MPDAVLTAGPSVARTVLTTRPERERVSSTSDHFVNGIVSLVISVGITVGMADDDDGPWDLQEMALAVGISAFLSGFFTSYFAK